MAHTVYISCMYLSVINDSLLPHLNTFYQALKSPWSFTFCLHLRTLNPHILVAQSKVTRKSQKWGLSNFKFMKPYSQIPCSPLSILHILFVSRQLSVPRLLQTSYMSPTIITFSLPPWLSLDIFFLIVPPTARAEDWTWDFHLLGKSSPPLSLIPNPWVCSLEIMSQFSNLNSLDLLRQRNKPSTTDIYPNHFLSWSARHFSPDKG